MTTVSEPKIVRGVDLNKVDLTTLNIYGKKAGLKFSATDKVEARVAAYADWVLTEKDEGKIADCKVCGGASHLALPKCPYCGVGEESPVKGAPATTKQKSVASKPAKQKPAKQKPAETKPSKERPAASPTPAAIEPAGPAAMKGAARELDASVKKIKGLKGEAVACYWRLGQALYDNFSRGLYKFRTDDKRQPVYKSWAAFCTAELDLSPQMARDIMAVSQTFTEEQIREFGVSKLKVLIRIPEEARARLLEAAGTMSAREVKEEVRRVAPGATREPIVQPGSGGGFGESRTGKPASGIRPRVVPVPDEQLVVVQSVQRIEVPLLARNRTDDLGNAVRAESLDDDPHAVSISVNGVETHYRLVKHEGVGLVLIVELRAAASAAKKTA